MPVVMYPATMGCWRGWAWITCAVSVPRGQTLHQTPLEANHGMAKHPVGCFLCCSLGHGMMLPEQVLKSLRLQFATSLYVCPSGLQSNMTASEVVVQVELLRSLAMVIAELAEVPDAALAACAAVAGRLAGVYSGLYPVQCVGKLSSLQASPSCLDLRQRCCSSSSVKGGATPIFCAARAAMRPAAAVVQGERAAAQ